MMTQDQENVNGTEAEADGMGTAAVTANSDGTNAGANVAESSNSRTRVSDWPSSSAQWTRVRALSMLFTLYLRVEEMRAIPETCTQNSRPMNILATTSREFMMRFRSLMSRK